MKFPWKAYFELGRASNLPTCVSNIAVGFLIAGGNQFSTPLFAVLIAAICFYEAGMICNDLFDYEIDIKQNRGRPLASGVIERKHAFIMMVLLFAIGYLYILLFAPQALITLILLFFCILIYNFWHKKFIGSPIFMGACRSCLYILGAQAAGWNWNFDLVAAFALILWAYIALVTLIARDEIASETNLTQKISAALAFLVCCLPIIYKNNTTSLLVFLPLGYWVGHIVLQLWKGQIANGPAVGKLLAAICLLDSFILASQGHWIGWALAGICFSLTQFLHKKIRGT